MADGKIRQARAERDEARRDLDRLRAKLKRLGDFYQPELDRLRAALREARRQLLTYLPPTDKTVRLLDAALADEGERDA